MNVDLRSLVGKLNDTCRTALESAAGLCLSKTHYEVEIEHFLLKLGEVPDGDLLKIYHQYGVDPSRVTQDLMRSLDRFKTGNGKAPSLSPRLPRVLKDAWSLASVQYELPRVRSGLLLLAVLLDEDLARVVPEMSDELRNISAETLRQDFLTIVDGSSEDDVGVGDASAAAPAGGKKQASKTPGLDSYTIDLTGQARTGKIDPILGRDGEIRQMIDILMRRRKNNPILTGEAGVGKTAVVEGLALRIAEGDVPPPLRDVAIHTLDMGLLQAGAGVKGEFENRLKSVIQEVKSSPRPIVLFIDEAHTLIGAGGQAGGSDAANLLKPALARGELRTVAATTWSEYKKYFEKDAALERRFQVIKVEEPDEEKGILMMRGLTGTFEKHHQVRILDEAVEDAVRLSNRYISGRQLPDKSVDVLDTAAARVALAGTATPPQIEDLKRRITSCETQIRVLEREELGGADHAKRLDEVRAEKTQCESDLEGLESRYAAESELIGEMRDIRRRLEGPTEEELEDETAEPPPELTDAEREELRSRLKELDEKLQGLQGEEPLMQVFVDRSAVSDVISSWTGIPVGKMLEDEITTILKLRELLEERVIGQSHALESIAQRVRTSRAGLDDPSRPVGVFLLVGPSGVGKTETALALADSLYGGERNMVTVNMSEYQEAHSVSRLKGSPPGYVGFGEGGVLTEAVRQRPYSVVLMDEVEKAHPDVLELFYQVFDKGTLEDGEGRIIDFKNTLILMTSNLGSDEIMKLSADPETAPEADGLADAIRPALLSFFAPALLGRMIVVPYYPISDDMMKSIIRLKLGKVRDRLRANHEVELTLGDDVVDQIAARCTEVESGARNVDHIVTRTLLPEISQELLGRMAAGQETSKVVVSVGDDGSFAYEIG